jgi:phage terminase Nu1 subunit (DNA packaging protein)
MSPAVGPEENLPSVIAGLITRGQLAAQLGRSERTVIRWEHAGLPVIKLGATRLYDPVKARAWLLTHERRHDMPKRGRPLRRRP